MSTYYAKSHECFKLTESKALVSITAYAVEQLGEITYVQLPEEGDELTKGASFGEVESVKTVSELYSPLSGTVIKINPDLDEEPEILNNALVEKGWLIEIELSHPEEIESHMNEADYKTYINGLS